MGSLIVTVEATYRVIPGEPMVRYYADGSGFPGTDSSIDCIDSAEVVEIEYQYGGEWCCTDRAGFGERVAIADRWACDELSSGKHDDELLDYDGGDDYGC